MPAIRDDARLSAIRRGTEYLVAKGFHSVEPRELAQACNISESALAKSFGAPENLLGQIVRSFTEDVRRRIFSVKPDGRPTREFLMDYASNYLRCILDRNAVRCFRFACGLASDFPQVSTQFKASARTGNAEFAVLLETETDIVLPDGYTWDDASAQFYALCKGGFHHQLLFDVDYVVIDAEIMAQAERAVGTFLRAFPSKAERDRA